MPHTKHTTAPPHSQADAITLTWSHLPWALPRPWTCVQVLRGLMARDASQRWGMRELVASPAAPSWLLAQLAREHQDSMLGRDYYQLLVGGRWVVYLPGA